MQLRLQKIPEFEAYRRKALVGSAVLHVLLLLFFVINPDFLASTPRRVVRVSGDDFDTDRFEVVELYVPPDIVEPLPQIAQVLPPKIAAPAPEPEPLPELVPAEPEPQPELPPVPPPPVIGPDDVIAEGARPDAPVNPPEAVAAAELSAPALGKTSAEGDGGGNQGSSGNVLHPETRPSPPSPPEPDLPVEVAENTNPNALALPSLRRQAESIIDELIAQGRGASGGADGLPGAPNLKTEQPTILSDTRGYDFGPYMNQVINRVRTNWYSLIPEAARIGTQRGRVVIVFTITASGRVEGLRAVLTSGAAALDRAAAGAVQASNPFPELPPDFMGDQLVLQFTFLYNMTP